MTGKPTVTACVVTFNEEANIERCLSSVDWCDEIVVVDSFSTDRTVEMAKRFTDNIIQREWPGFRAQKEFARQQGTGEWSLLIDADEEVSPELKAEILLALQGGQAVGYTVPRLVFFLGRWIRHGDWYPDRKLRLYRTAAGEVKGIDPHDYVEVEGPVGKLNHPLFHYTYDDIAHHIRTSNTFTSILAREMHQRGKRFSYIDLLFRPGWKFLRGYLFKAGFLDGFAGLAIALVSAFSTCEKYLKLHELQRTANKKA